MVDLVQQDDRPLAVPKGVVERLLAAVNVDGFIDFRDDLEVGDQVRLLSVPFFNLVGRLQHLDAQGRVKVLLSILGGERVVSADRTALQRVTA